MNPTTKSSPRATRPGPSSADETTSATTTPPRQPRLAHLLRSADLRRRQAKRAPAKTPPKPASARTSATSASSPPKTPPLFEDIVPQPPPPNSSPGTPPTQLLADYIARAHWQLYRSDFYFESDLARQDGGFIDTANKFERYRASNQRRLFQLQKQFADLRAAHQKEQQTTAAEAAKLPPSARTARHYEVDRKYAICKFSNNPTPRHYIHNFATEKIIMSDGKYWFARTIPLAELMEGEFLKPQYGLGNHFAEAFREWSKTNKLYHPGEPYVTKKWPPPVPKDCPPDDWFLDRELSLAEDPVAILKQRAQKMDEEERLKREEEAADWRRQFEEARQYEAERQRLELEEELKPKPKDDEDEDEEEDREDQEQDRDPDDSDRGREDA